MINNVSNNTISGSIKEINQEYSGFECTPVQFYFSLFCVTIVLVTLIIMITRLIQTAILRINYIKPHILQSPKEEILKELKIVHLSSFV